MNLSEIVVPGGNFLFWLLTMIIWVVSIFWAIAVARVKNRSSVVWGVLALLFGFWALVVVLALPSKAPNFNQLDS